CSLRITTATSGSTVRTPTACSRSTTRRSPASITSPPKRTTTARDDGVAGRGAGVSPAPHRIRRRPRDKEGLQMTRQGVIDPPDPAGESAATRGACSMSAPPDQASWQRVEGTEEGREFLSLRVIERERPEFALACRRFRGSDVMRYHPFEVGYLAGVHVGRAAGCAPERRRLERPQHLGAGRRHEPQFRTVRRLRIAVGAEAVERILADQERAGLAAPVLGKTRHGRNASVVEVAVRQERSAMAVDAATRAEEHSQARYLLRRQQSGPRELARGHPEVKAGLGRRDGALEGGDGLADIGKDQVDG